MTAVKVKTANGWVTLSGGGLPMPVVDGQFVKGVGGAAVWAPIPPAGATVATSIAGLGTPSDGKQGLLRIGSGTTQSFLPVTYDNTLAKWVSPSSGAWNQGMTYSFVAGTAAAAIASFSLVDYAAHVAAGLTPQFLLAGMNVLAAGSAYSGVNHFWTVIAYNLAYGYPSTGLDQSGYVWNSAAVVAQKAYAAFALGWSPVPTFASPKNMLWMYVSTWHDPSVPDAVSVYGTTMYQRWVST